MEKEKNAKKLNVPESIPCFLCGDFQKIKLTKNNKPYFICDTCGIQAFIRKTDGINRLTDLINNSTLYKKIYLTGQFLENAHLFRLKERIKLIKKTLSGIGYNIFAAKELELHDVLTSKLKHLESEYNNYLKKIDN